MGEATATPEMQAELAAGLRAHELNVGWAVETVLRSAAFFSEANLGTKVIDPAGYVVGPVRALGLSTDGVDPLALASWMAGMGQDLFYPPNVGGWPEGRSWLSTRSTIRRANYAAALVEGHPVGLAGPVDFPKIAARCGQESNTAFLARLLVGCDHPTIPIDGVRATGPAVARLLASPDGHRG
jgi:hypothetical protein